MKTLENRVRKLESTMTPTPMVFHVARIIVDPENPNPIGYTCDGITIARKNGETNESLHKRCIDAVTWPDFSHRHIFEPLEGVCH